MDLGGVVEVPDEVGGGRGRAAEVATYGQRVIDAVFLAGDLVVDPAGDVVEFFPFRPLRIGPLARPSVGQLPDRGDLCEVVWVVGGELVPVLDLADQPGLELPEPIDFHAGNRCSRTMIRLHPYSPENRPSDYRAGTRRG